MRPVNVSPARAIADLLLPVSFEGILPGAVLYRSSAASCSPHQLASRRFPEFAADFPGSSSDLGPAGAALPLWTGLSFVRRLSLCFKCNFTLRPCL